MWKLSEFWRLLIHFDHFHLQEQHRRQWLAELDRQVEERRMAREQERLQHPAVNEPGDYHHYNDDKMKATSALYDTNHVESKSTNFGRGRGLADLLGKQYTDSSSKRQRQLDLRVRKL